MLMVLIDFKGYCQGQKGPIWTFVIYLGQYLRNGACCDQCHRRIKGLSLINGASYDRILYEIHITSHIWPFSLPYNIWPLMKLKGQIKVIGFQLAIFHKLSTFWHLWTISLPQDIWPWINLHGRIKVTWLQKVVSPKWRYTIFHKHIVNHIWSFSLTFDLGWHWKVKCHPRSVGVLWDVYHTQCIIRQASCYYMALQFTYLHTEDRRGNNPHLYGCPGTMHSITLGCKFVQARGV